jgi:hypothetical protein
MTQNGMPPNGQPQAAPQQPQQQGEPLATPQQIAAAQQVLRKVRKEIAKFHEIRRRNNEVAAGLRQGSVPPDQARQIILQGRDPSKERQAVEQLRQLITIIHGRPPTKEEMQIGIPEGFEAGMGAIQIPAVVAIGLASAGAGVFSVFSYLRAREETIQHQTATPMERMMNAAANNIWAIAAAGAVGLGAVMYFKGKEAGEKEPIKKLSSLAERLGTKGDLESNPGETIKGWMAELPDDDKRKLGAFLIEQADNDDEDDDLEEEEVVEEEVVEEEPAEDEEDEEEIDEEEESEDDES